ncbi:hypothetical protein HHI36_014482 [Cryptolaemus montrouzieri]|uniref:Uncharacterized protein n=1 Tax=Cryptolaemus montrouzieri TaxID=559131 RepID=A0ABD2N3X0_9CUCU
MENPDSKRALTIHDTILNISAAWEAIKPETNQNCYKKAGFRNNGVDDVLEGEKEPIKLQGFPRYSSIDNNVAPYEFQTIEDLIETANNTQKEAQSIMMKMNDDTGPTIDHCGTPALILRKVYLGYPCTLNRYRLSPALATAVSQPKVLLRSQKIPDLMWCNTFFKNP